MINDIIRTDDASTAWNEPFDLSCYIPRIAQRSPISQLLSSEARSSMKSRGFTHYDGIFSRAHSKTSHSGESSRSFYLFPNDALNAEHHQKEKEESHHLLQSATGNRGKLLSYMMYTDEKWGIIGSGGTFTPSLYQLKLSELTDREFKFTEISQEENAESVFGRHLGYQCKQYLMLLYLADQERVFAVQCKQEHGQSAVSKAPQNKIKGAKCGIYDLPSNRWKEASHFRANTYLHDDEDNFRCGLSYNVSGGSAVYLVSNLGRTAKYDFVKNGWNILYENVSDANDMRFEKGPIVWHYQYSPHVLYCLGGKAKQKARKGSRPSLLAKRGSSSNVYSSSAYSSPPLTPTGSSSANTSFNFNLTAPKTKSNLDLFTLASKAAGSSSNNGNHCEHEKKKYTLVYKRFDMRASEHRKW
eukprot:CAMPEP_0197044598 /NCGR_PEP_ID=MMETSP1384-20130603/20619_1 /TAXON_ID=29189 /ORGANISM="Ammonia sp." /LENGTH=413 /DNA_ID=CAMNT_0042476085 /DNA_START=25 /DNA_END=1263 /DNA_ORIENTATION=+